MLLRKKADHLFLIQKEGRNAHIEGLRAIAIVLVFNVHFFSQYEPSNYFFIKDSLGYNIAHTLHAGMIGVDLFFVLSGYLIYNVVSRGDLSFGIFLYNRIKRLLPANLIVTIILAWSSFSIIRFILNVFFLPDFFVSNPTYNYVNWSLSWEWLFYFWIFFFIKFAKKSDSVLMVLMLLSLCFLVFNQLYLYQYLAMIKIKLPMAGRFVNFYIGVIVALLEKRNFKISNAKAASFIYIILILVVVPSLSYYWSTGNVFSINGYFGLVGITFGIILFLTNNADVWFKSVFKLYIFRLLGQLSYSFYLIHAVISIPLANWLYSYLAPQVTTVKLMLLNYLFVFGVTVLLASVSYVLLERPFMVKKFKKAYVHS